jgi:hypothetical protein
MGPVEDPDVSTGRAGRVDSPEEVVRLLQRGGRLEGRDDAALRIDAAHDVPNGPVLAGRIDPLQHYQDCAAPLGVEAFLEDIEFLPQVLGTAGGFFPALVVTGSSCIVVLQIHAHARVDSIVLHPLLQRLRA